jgi:hypothetical protein
MMVTVALAMGWPASGQSQTPEPGGEKPADPAMVDVADVLGLPRVLLIGDSISLGYTLPVRARLAGIANVHRPAANAGPTTVGVKDLDAWLHVGAAAGEPSKAWDVIHVNFGLHDLKIMKPGPDGGVRQVPPAEYEANLRALIGRLRATGASLVWASTTPVPDAPQKPMRPGRGCRPVQRHRRAGDARQRHPHRRSLWRRAPAGRARSRSPRMCISPKRAMNSWRRRWRTPSPAPWQRDAPSLEPEARLTPS